MDEKTVDFLNYPIYDKNEFSYKLSKISFVTDEGFVDLDFKDPLKRNWMDITYTGAVMKIQKRRNDEHFKPYYYLCPWGHGWNGACGGFFPCISQKYVLTTEIIIDNNK